ncbi:putative uncharacterized protein [[Clostridium] clostridioforme CAG:511]|nr:putative uncharacterized protein [[Clostridium] clostridioforme CAG:511]
MAAAAYVMDAEEGQTDAAFLGENLNTLKAESGSGLSPSSDIGSPADTGRKLIRDVNMSVEARDFDGVLSQITDKVRELGGYVESSDVSGISVNSYGGSQQRYADIRARIPADRLDRFVETVESAGNVTSKQEQVTDVTLQYSDVQSRKKSMEIEQERLWALLEKAESLDAVVALEARLSEIRYELESYTSQLRLYDNQVDYSTVSINMREVKDLTPTAPDSIGTRIQKGFNRSLNNLGEAGTDLIVWIASNSPILLVLAVIIAAVVLFVRGLSRRMQGRLRFLSRSSNSRGKYMGEKKGRRDRKVQAAEEQTEKAVEEQTENRKTLEEQTEKMQKEKE